MKLINSNHYSRINAESRVSTTIWALRLRPSDADGTARARAKLSTKEKGGVSWMLWNSSFYRQGFLPCCASAEQFDTSEVKRGGNAETLPSESGTPSWACESWQSSVCELFGIGKAYVGVLTLVISGLQIRCYLVQLMLLSPCPHHVPQTGGN